MPKIVWYDSFPLESKQAVTNYFIAITCRQSLNEKYTEFCNSHKTNFWQWLSKTFRNLREDKPLKHLNSMYLDFALEIVKKWCPRHFNHDLERINNSINEKTRSEFENFPNIDAYCQKIKKDRGLFLFHLSIIMKELLNDDLSYSIIKKSVEKHDIKNHNKTSYQNIETTLKTLPRAYLEKEVSDMLIPDKHSKWLRNLKELRIDINKSIFDDETIKMLLEDHKSEDIYVFQHVNLLNFYINVFEEVMIVGKTNEESIMKFQEKIVKELNTKVLHYCKEMKDYMKRLNGKAHILRISYLQDKGDFFECLQIYLECFIKDKNHRDALIKVSKTVYDNYFRMQST